MALEEKCMHKQSWCHQLVSVKYYVEYYTNWSFYGKYYGANDRLSKDCRIAEENRAMLIHIIGEDNSNCLTP